MYTFSFGGNYVDIALKNTDDHLVNHGFLLITTAWDLSPAYEINPIYYGTGLSLNISETYNSLNFDLACEAAKYFRLNVIAPTIPY